MFLNEVRKLQIENSYYYDQKEGNRGSIYSDKEGLEWGLLKIEKESYDHSLEFNEILFKNGKTHNNFDDGPDVANIAAENLLYKYGLQYPISWYVEYEDSDGLHFGYNYSDKIDIDHKGYIYEVESLFSSGKISELEKERLLAAGEYYRSHHKLLSKYFNGEELEVNEEKGHTR